MIANQGHAAVFDAKWSPDGMAICASDSHGQIHFIGHGAAERFEKYPAELFFHTDYRPLLRDSFHNVIDEQTQLPPHLLPPPFLVDSEGAPYPPYIQRLIPGREKMTDQEAMLPFGADPSNQQQQQQQQNQNDDDDAVALPPVPRPQVVNRGAVAAAVPPEPAPQAVRLLKAATTAFLRS